MIGRIAALYSYSTAPKTTFYMKHPVKALQARRTVNKLTGTTARRVAAGVGAAALAVPLGLWLGQKGSRA